MVNGTRVDVGLMLLDSLQIFGSLRIEEKIESQSVHRQGRLNY